MPTLTLNHVPVNYVVTGSGPRVLLIMGAGSPGRVWNTYQVPALVKAGFEVVTMDNRGITSTAGIEGMSIADLAADAAALIEHLGGPAHVIGTSLGSRVVQELAITRPELIAKAISSPPPVDRTPSKPPSTADNEPSTRQGSTCRLPTPRLSVRC